MQANGRRHRRLAVLACRRHCDMPSRPCHALLKRYAVGRRAIGAAMRYAAGAQSRSITANAEWLWMDSKFSTVTR